MNVTEVEPLPSDPTTDEWMEDSRRIKEENKSERKPHRDMMNYYGSVEHFYMRANHAAYVLGLEYFG